MTPSNATSMAGDFSHQGIFSNQPPPNGFGRSTADYDDDSQIRGDKLRLPELEAAPAADDLLPQIHHPEGRYEAAGMWSEMFNFGGAAVASTATSELRHQSPEISAAMQLFLTNPQRESPPPPPHHHQPPPPTHMLLPGQNIPWVSDGGMVKGQGLSLSLSSKLEAAKAAEELRTGGGGMMFFSGQEMGAACSPNHSQNQHVVMPLQGYRVGRHQGGHFGFTSFSAPSSSLGAVDFLRHSKYTKPTQELLEEFCSIGRGHLKKNKFIESNAIGNSATNAAMVSTGESSGGGLSPSSRADDPLVLSPADRMEHQRRKVKLLSMLDEVERRYHHYCEQLQMVVSSFDLVVGFGAAVPYTGPAQKAMSRHFRSLKDAVQGQLKHSCELLGEKDVIASTSLTKGETLRLKALEQSLRQQRAFNQIGMMDEEAAWRPQRGLPEHSVNILRAWLFEHFLHPYPGDADKQLLARQTGLSRNQVSNWFINARVRLWKPMVEEMYRQEAEEGEYEVHRDQSSKSESSIGARSTTAETTVAAENTTEWCKAGLEGSRSHCDDEGMVGPTMMRFGVGGDTSLTLGLRQIPGRENPSKTTSFPLGGFES